MGDKGRENDHQQLAAVGNGERCKFAVETTERLVVDDRGQADEQNAGDNDDEHGVPDVDGRGSMTRFRPRQPFDWRPRRNQSGYGRGCELVFERAGQIKFSSNGGYALRVGHGPQMK